MLSVLAYPSKVQLDRIRPVIPAESILIELFNGRMRDEF